MAQGHKGKPCERIHISIDRHLINMIALVEATLCADSSHGEWAKLAALVKNHHAILRIVTTTNVPLVAIPHALMCDPHLFRRLNPL